MTEVALYLPDEVAQQLSEGGRDLSRRALEALAIEAYRARELSVGGVRKMLGFASRWEAEGFLRAHDIDIPYTEGDIASEIAAARQVARP
jgi:hypothetical protein